MKLHSLASRIILLPYYQNFNLVVIIINSIILSMDSYPMDPDLSKSLDNLNFVLTLYFTLELALNICGTGIIVFFSDSEAIFDSVVVLISCVDVMMNPPSMIEPIDNDPRKNQGKHFFF